MTAPLIFFDAARLAALPAGNYTLEQIAGHAVARDENGVIHLIPLIEINPQVRAVEMPCDCGDEPA